ncbi:MAG TPA: hypothetical protein VK541_05370 [Pedobacter sp.]|uniref:hypothetical protein n=1 Tax=Pedobacter sp. TaxID=1411316 RepID=UPI002CAA35C1|nr:hypothetical protein [Pedobacter sp.]HMI01889.1 hypothetical protein [Pedobacter sp.]
MDIIKNSIYSRVRNTRIAFLVDRSFESKNLAKLIADNYDLWGGSYNPIIPVSDSQVEENWVGILEQVDPDLVYYSEGIALELLKEQAIDIHPREYKELQANRIWNFQGVNAYAFLEEYFKASSERRHISLAYYAHNLDHHMCTFYGLNFGVRPHYVEDQRYVQDFNTAWIGAENIDQILSQMYSRYWYSKNLLSGMMVTNEILNAENAWSANNFELVIYEGDDCFDDLLYFWNRKVYQTPGKKICQMIVSISELDELKNNPFFLSTLKQISEETTVDLSSRSLDKEHLEKIKDTFNALGNGIKLNVKAKATFPYAFEQIRQVDDTDWIKTLIKGDEDFIDIRNQGPVALNQATGTYELDIRIIQDKNRDVNKIKFPYNYLLRKSVSSTPGRVNRLHDLSFSINHTVHGIDIRVPETEEILSSRIQIRHVAGTLERTEGLISASISDAGTKLSAFLKLFKGDWNLIRRDVMDKFWLEAFTGTSGYKSVEALLTDQNDRTDQPRDQAKVEPEILCSKVLKGNGIFSLKDLEYELKLIYYKYQDKIGENFQDSDLSLTDEFIATAVKEESDKDLLPTLDSFVELEAIFIGLNVKCPHCSSRLWYPLKELSHRMNCRGCDHPVSPQAESEFYYRVNDVILNNLMSDPVKRTKEFYGNYVVLKTLEDLRSDIENAYSSFGFSPSLDIEYVINPEAGEDNQVKAMTDVDIVALQSGKLVLGEAKVQAKAFKGDQIKQLIWIGRHIKPDVLLLAYKEGEIGDEKLEQIRTGIGDKRIKIVAHKISEPWFQFGHLFGIPR